MKATTRKEKLTRALDACTIYGITGGNRDVVPLVQDMQNTVYELMSGYSKVR